MITPSFNLVARAYEADPTGAPAGLTVTRASSGTRIGPRGLIETVAANILRHDYHPVSGEHLGWLIEPQRTNLWTHSDEFDNAAWQKANAGVAVNSGIAPDGATTGDRLIPDTANTTHRILRGYSGTAAAHSFSIFAKAAGYPILHLRYYDTGLATEYGAAFDLASGAISQTESGVTAVIRPFGDGWYRCAITRTLTASSGTLVLYAKPDTATYSYAGNGSSGLYLWGAQAEIGAFPTSYIPAGAASATRNTDVVSLSLDGFRFNAAEGTFYLQGDAVAPGGVFLEADDGSNANRIALCVDADGVPRLSGQPLALDLGSGTIVADSAFRFAGAYKAGDFAASLNGGAVQVQAGGTLPGGLTTLRIGNRFGNDAAASGHIRHLAYFPGRMVNADLQTITL